MAISKILAPVDFSDRCLEMLPYVTTIASRYSAGVTLLHVVNPVYTLPAAGPLTPILIPVPPSVLTEAQARLDSFGSDRLSGVNARRLIYEGDAVDQIVDFTKAENTDLVVMPTHGYGAIRAFLIGSVAAKILHDVACPVLTAVHPGKPVFSKVLCAVNLGPDNDRTLTWATQFSKDFQIHLDVFNPTSGPVDSVCSEAAARAADLLVIGRGSRESFGIVRHAPCPVVSV